MIIAIIVADLLMTGAFIYRFPHLPPQIPLFYSRAWGDDQLADIWLILILPFLLHFFVIINGYIYKKFFAPDQLFAKIVAVINWSIVIVITCIFLKIVFFIS